MAQIADRVENRDAALFFDLLDQVVDCHQGARSTYTSAAVDQNGPPVRAVVFVQAAEEAKDPGGMLGCLEILPDQIVILKHWANLALHHAQFWIRRRSNFGSGNLQENKCLACEGTKVLKKRQPKYLKFPDNIFRVPLFLDMDDSNITERLVALRFERGQ